MVAALLIAACADDKEFAEFTQPSQSGTTVTVAASMPGGKSVSKIGLAQSDNSLNIISQWQSADEVQIFVSQNGNSFEIGKSPVQNISNDGKSCSFSFDLPSEISADAPYSVYGFCGIDGKLENGTITIDAAAKRIPLAKMKAPCYFVAQPTSANFEAKFNHIGTYEILHVANNSTSEITFTHNGYTTSSPWYYNAMHGTLPCSTSTGTLTNTGADGEAVSESATIPAGTTASIVSWYLPTGSAVSEAVLNAAINGNVVKSSDKKSSTVSIQNGKAYHLYATWNGTELRFLPNENPDNPPVSELSDGLVAYYPFDTNADDYSGNGNNGTVTNLSLVSGVKGNAYKFAGVDDPGWIQVPNSESLQFTESASFSMWFNVSSYRGHDGWANTTDYGCLKLFSKDYDRNEIHADLGGFTDDKWRISFWGICNGREGNWIDIEGSILNQWHHVAFVATNNYLKIYIDGNLVNETECESNFSYSNSNDLWIGRLNSYYAYYFNGLIDEFRVYNRALNSTEVSELYNMYEPENEPIQQDVSKSYVDLGLPSGTLWATCNVGAKNPWESGDYFAWGETEARTVCEEELYTYQDSPSELDSQHDAATVNMGSEWKMPTYKQWAELRDNCEWEYTTNYNGTGVTGFLVYGVDSRSKFIFLPIQSYKENEFCEYWLSSIYEPQDGYAWNFHLLPPDEVSAGYAPGGCYRYRLNSVRAVRK